MSDLHQANINSVHKPMKQQGHASQCYNAMTLSCK